MAYGEENKGNIKINVRTIPSRRRSAINIWVCWNDREIIIRRRRIGRIVKVGIINIAKGV
jgi:hypothetical protein